MKINFLNGIWAMLLTLISTQAMSQMKVSGTVTDAADGHKMPGVTVTLKGTETHTTTNRKGYYEIAAPDPQSVLVFSAPGYTTKEEPVRGRKEISVQMEYVEVEVVMEEVVTMEELSMVMPDNAKMKRGSANKSYEMPGRKAAFDGNVPPPRFDGVTNTEEYAEITENGFQNPLSKPYSTFSIDVDAASYSQVRRFVNLGQLPPKDAVRIEEMINYFDYDYVPPKGDNPFAIDTEIGVAPWNTRHKLIRIGLQGKEMDTDDLPPSNLVFLIDVSGSMSQANKLPLLKSAFRLLLDKLRPEDKVAIVVYAGAAGEVLPSTPASEKDKILEAMEGLNAGGSTAGGAGIQLAYKIAKQQFIAEGNNRVILATDGDFNVGASSNEAMEKLIEEKRKEDNIFLTVLGFGMGNYKDAKMELLADKGNGNYAYIDNILEAKKVLVSEFGGTLFTIAKDVKIQVEFNPAKVRAYRLLGYENRLLNDEDFNNDRKDAGELGAGHTVTALYEVVPAGVESEFVADDPKYQTTTITDEALASDEIVTIKLRYKAPDGEQSRLTMVPLKDRETTPEKMSDNFKWAAAVAAFGMQLRDSDLKGDMSYADIYELAKTARGTDEKGYRAEFLRLVESCRLLTR